MSQYPSPDALLADAYLRLDKLSSDLGILILEGSDDKRFFSPWSVDNRQLLVAGNKKRLLHAQERSTPDDSQRLLFIADADYDLLLGRCHPDSNLAFTANCDLECDLIELDGLRRAQRHPPPRPVQGAQPRSTKPEPS
jgi:hypothetical protein